MVNEEGVTFINNKPIIIGNEVWIGNRVTINKGSIIPDQSIIASNSLVNRLLDNSNGGVFGEIPAKCLGGKGRYRIFDRTVELKIYQYFELHKGTNSINTTDIL